MSGLRTREQTGTVTDYRAITPEVAVLVMEVVDERLIIVLPRLPALQPSCGGPATGAAHLIE